MLVIWDGIGKMLVRIVNRENPDQNASPEIISFFRSSLIWVCTVYLGLYGRPAGVQNFRTFNVHSDEQVFVAAPEIMV